MVRAVRSRVLDDLRKYGPEEHRCRTEAEWLAAWDMSLGGTEIMPREYAVDEKYVAGLFRALDKDKHGVGIGDPALALQVWAETHADDVFYYCAGKEGGTLVRATPPAAR